MQRSAATAAQAQAQSGSTPFFSSLFGTNTSSHNTNTNAPQPSSPAAAAAKHAQRPPSSGADIAGGSPRKTLHKERKPSFSRKPSFGRKPSFIFSSSSSSRNRERERDRDRDRDRDSASSTNTAGPSLAPPVDGGGTTGPDPAPNHHPAPPVQAQAFYDSHPGPLPSDPSSSYYPADRPSSSSKMLSRGAVTPLSGYQVGMASGGSMLSGAGLGPQSELTAVHQHIQETASKRISTLEYLRKAHEGRIYWFNTLLFDKPDLQRMPYFDPRKLGRRATNYLLLGISLPAVIDLNSNTPLDFLRSLNTLLAEFDAFQQIHTETGIAATSLTRTRIPQMFRRAAAPVSKGRRSSSSATAAAAPDIGYALEQVDSNTTTATGAAPPSTTTPGAVGGGTDAPPAGAVMAFGASEVDLLPGEEYTHLLTPTLPFDPDFFETFATLCDVLIDTYSRLLSLLPTPRECGGSVAELFGKADSKIRKLFIQGAVREFEEVGRAGGRGEVASIGRVVLSGLM
ncbi:hypothetical protein C8A05DRAFT_34843 [Staphylotrichum tortipilum]|uniref:Uncharacterized protein n=1 Tax=Staphylotrichum tortipilum TaxID=2831512 RepID=A0AAN6MJS6_9PEZI|nr:hypothetical protein C8A05DRAFT_34843 [Staphylotrichum longicolle]